MSYMKTLLDGQCTCHTGAWHSVTKPGLCSYCRAARAWKLGVRDCDIKKETASQSAGLGFDTELPQPEKCPQSN